MRFSNILAITAIGITAIAPMASAQVSAGAAAGSESSPVTTNDNRSDSKSAAGAQNSTGVLVDQRQNNSYDNGDGLNPNSVGYSATQLPSGDGYLLQTSCSNLGMNWTDRAPKAGTAINVGALGAQFGIALGGGKMPADFELISVAHIEGRQICVLRQVAHGDRAIDKALELKMIQSLGLNGSLIQSYRNLYNREKLAPQRRVEKQTMQKLDSKIKATENSSAKAVEIKEAVKVPAVRGLW